jgi:two-component system, NtrC family, nitrogen regulation sensor histidine kinase NtrY
LDSAVVRSIVGWKSMVSSPQPDYRTTSNYAPSRRKRRRFHYESRVLALSIVAAIPGTIAFASLLWLTHWTNSTRYSLIVLLLLLQLILVAVLHEQIIRPLQTLTNVVSALREEDYSFRARGASNDDSLGELALEINTLADLLADERTRTIEATALLRRVVDVVDVPLFAFDPNRLLRLVNTAGERLLQKPAAALIGRSADDINLESCFTAEDQTQIVLPQSANSRWFIRRSQFRQAGVPHTLIVLSDVSRALRDEERSAWQRLIRVLGHELNNSLAPIKSIAGTLASRVGSLPIADQERDDFARGLNIIESRSASLNRFLQAYRRLAQMPQPSLQEVNIRDLLVRVASVEQRVSVHVLDGPNVSIRIDPDQIEQLMINLVKNAAEATLELHSEEKPAEVEINWENANGNLQIRVADQGPGLLNPDNAFVPFYTTKAEGTGIGLVLSRQIAEAHHGSIHLSNRLDRVGCVATVTLPVG